MRYKITFDLVEDIKDKVDKESVIEGIKLSILDSYTYEDCIYPENIQVEEVEDYE